MSNKLKIMIIGDLIRTNKLLISNIWNFQYKIAICNNNFVIVTKIKFNLETFYLAKYLDFLKEDSHYNR